MESDMIGCNNVGSFGFTSINVYRYGSATISGIITSDIYPSVKESEREKREKLVSNRRYQNQ
uniref:Uncharacterized protein n=1 Tax=Onchocerca volvulus TaxID=6282 RepID=A0A8R1XW11_ONCVO